MWRANENALSMNAQRGKKNREHTLLWPAMIQLKGSLALKIGGIVGIDVSNSLS